MNSFFQPVAIGAPGKGSVAYAPAPGTGPSRLSQEAQQQHQRGILSQPQRQEEERQQSSNNFNRNQFQQAPTNSAPTASSPTGSSLVAGGPGTGMAASYAPSFGLGGAVSSGGLGSYAGATGLMQGTAAGTGAGWSGLGAASSGLTYGGATGAATTGAGSSFFGLGGASAGLTYGGGAAAGGAAAGGAAGGAGAGAAGGAAGGGAAGGAAMAGPWAALAAVIAINEKYQKKQGNRAEGSKYWTDLLTGNKIVERDADTLGEKVDKGNKIGLKGDWQVAGDITSFDFSNAFKGLKDTTGIKTIKKLFGS